MRALCLVGMSGIGKSFWARRLEQAGLERHDCDGDIARRIAAHVALPGREDPAIELGRWMGMPWMDGYSEREAEYLELEEKVTRDALDAIETRERAHVLDSTGSVVYLSGALLADLRARCRVVYLRTPESHRDAMRARYLAEPKPVVWGGAFAARAGEAPLDALPRCYAALLAERDARYTGLADVVLDGAELEANDPGVAGFLELAGV